MTSLASIPATGQPRMLRGTSPQACSEDRPTSSSRAQIVGHVLDPDPVELHVLPVGDVGEVAAVLLGDPGDRAQLVGAQLAARDTHPHHEVGVLDLGVLERAGLAAADAGAPLGVQAPPAEPAAQVGRVDRVEALAARICVTIRSLTFSPASSFLNLSAAFSGS